MIRKLSSAWHLFRFTNCNIHSFIHQFIADISIAPLQVGYTITQIRFRLQHWYCFGINTPKLYMQLLVKGLPMAMVPKNLQPSERKAPTYHWATTCQYTFRSITLFIFSDWECRSQVSHQAALQKGFDYTYRIIILIIIVAAHLVERLDWCWCPNGFRDFFGVRLADWFLIFFLTVFFRIFRSVAQPIISTTSHFNILSVQLCHGRLQ